MSALQIIFCVYGLLLIAGGYFGYAKAKSKMSLVAGAVSGVLIFIGVFLGGTAGFVIFITVSAALTVVFLKRLLKTKKFMPSGMLMILSLGALILSLSGMMNK